MHVKIFFCSIIHFHQTESLCRRRHPCIHPRLAEKQLVNLLGPNLSLPHLYQGTGNDANHVTEKSRTFDIDVDEFTLLIDVHRKNSSDRGAHTRTGSTKRGVIPFTNEATSCFPHGIEIEIASQLPGEVAGQGRTVPHHVNSIPVMLTFCIAAGIEIRSRLSGLVDNYVGREQNVETVTECAQRQITLRPESRHHSPGVNPRIGTP